MAGPLDFVNACRVMRATGPVDSATLVAIAGGDADVGGDVRTVSFIDVERWEARYGVNPTTRALRGALAGETPAVRTSASLLRQAQLRFERENTFPSELLRNALDAARDDATRDQVLGATRDLALAFLKRGGVHQSDGCDGPAASARSATRPFSRRGDDPLFGAAVDIGELNAARSEARRVMSAAIELGLEASTTPAMRASFVDALRIRPENLPNDLASLTMHAQTAVAWLEQGGHHPDLATVARENLRAVLSSPAVGAELRAAFDGLEALTPRSGPFPSPYDDVVLPHLGRALTGQRLLAYAGLAADPSEPMSSNLDWARLATVASLGFTDGSDAQRTRLFQELAVATDPDVRAAAARLQTGRLGEWRSAYFGGLAYVRRFQRERETPLTHAEMEATAAEAADWLTAQLRAMTPEQRARIFAEHDDLVFRVDGLTAGRRPTLYRHAGGIGRPHGNVLPPPAVEAANELAGFAGPWDANAPEPALAALREQLMAEARAAIARMPAPNGDKGITRFEIEVGTPQYQRGVEQMFSSSAEFTGAEIHDAMHSRDGHVAQRTQ